MSEKMTGMPVRLPAERQLRRPKSGFQSVYDFLGAPLRMAMLPDQISEKFGLTSLRSERFAAVLPRLNGRVLDVGAGDNVLIRLYQSRTRGTEAHEAAAQSVGVDIFDWGGDCTILENTEKFPFPDNSFDTVSYVACINHIPERKESLKEARRILRPGGQVLITMIGRIIGTIGHKIWWYSEDKHRHVEEEEEMGMDPHEISDLLLSTGFEVPRIVRFLYGLNYLYISKKRE